MSITRWIRNVFSKADTQENADLVFHTKGRDRSLNIGVTTTSPHSVRDSLSVDDSFDFSVLPASGGKIVEFKRYNMKTSSNCRQLYIIPETENFADELVKIVTLELLRR